MSFRNDRIASQAPLDTDEETELYSGSYRSEPRSSPLFSIPFFATRPGLVLTEPQQSQETPALPSPSTELMPEEDDVDIFGGSYTEQLDLNKLKRRLSCPPPPESPEPPNAPRYPTRFGNNKSSNY